MTVIGELSRSGGSSPGLRVESVWKAHGRRQVLRGASLEVPPGSLVGVVGENGAGKTTLLRVICGQLVPDSGTVERFGRLGYCPQRAVLDETLTVDQHLRFFQVAYGLPTVGRARELLELLGFARYRRTCVAELSGGTRQKLNLTLALMHDPPVLVLDEPYQGFDFDTYQRFWALAQGLRDRGRSVLVVSHLAHDSERFDVLNRLENGAVHPESGAVHLENSAVHPGSGAVHAVEPDLPAGTRAGNEGPR
ncbi:ABC transporter ATP-binding protein [Streptomyces phaeochromogenes]|uniref:ABC transporter ATP-binding protein n=1 Tax=Streptomyces phaeochromogenes TaxID=1923 RepID=UPI003F4D4DC6